MIAGGGCNFESGLCTWQNARNDDFDWSLQKGRTASSNTGPSFDHTIGSSGHGTSGEIKIVFTDKLDYLIVKSCGTRIDNRDTYFKCL